MSQAMPEVTQARIEKVLKKEELNYQLDDDGEFAVPFSDHSCWIGMTNLTVYSTGVWDPSLPVEMREQVETQIRALNFDLLVPKFYYRELENGLRVFFETDAPRVEGLNDDQLHKVIVEFFKANHHAAAKLAEAFPAFANQDEE